MRINENGQMLDDMMLSLAMYWTGRSKPLWLKIWRIPELRGCQKAVANYPKRRKYIPYSHVNKFRNPCCLFTPVDSSYAVCLTRSATAVVRRTDMLRRASVSLVHTSRRFKNVVCHCVTLMKVGGDTWEWSSTLVLWNL
jgi:hypothetical protein